MKVLFVDDDKNILKSYQRFFREYNFDILTAENAKDAFDILKCEDEINLVVSDLKMPGIQGDDFVLILNMIYPFIDTVIVTGNSTVESATKVINEGNLSKYLLKPVDMDNLSETIEKILSKHSQDEKKLII